MYDNRVIHNDNFMPSLQFDSATLTKKIQVTVAETVANTMRDILTDPEYFCELQPWAKKRLALVPTRTSTFDEVKRKLKSGRKK